MNDVTTSLGESLETQQMYMRDCVWQLISSNRISLLLTIYKQDGIIKTGNGGLSIVRSLFVAGGSVSWV